MTRKLKRMICMLGLHYNLARAYMLYYWYDYTVFSLLYSLVVDDREKVTAHVSATNFKPQDVLESIRKVKMLETHVGMKQKQVSNLKLDASKIEAVKQLKGLLR